MDFVAEPHHTQEFHPTLYRQQEHNQQTRHYYPPPSPRPLTHSQPQSPVSTSPFSQSSFHQTSATERVLPEVGQTRCYWALLSSDLRFLVLDPVLAYHLHEQASDILNTSLLEFVHPEERNSAKQDLGGVLNERTLHGSVTRVRFCRLSCVRRLLGYTPSEEAPPYPPTFPADRIAIDYNYMAIDIVLNWAAEGVVLCFLHAVVDIAPREDNDESVKTGWSNWCSTYGFDEQQAQSMYRCLSDCILPQLRYHEGRKLDPSLRVLQILRNNADRTLLFSWPPQDISIQSYHAVPHAYDLGRLAQHVEIGTQGGGGEAKTSCTRRYKSYQKMPVATEDEGDVEVESIFVPHGTIIFACHKIDYVHRHPHSFSNGALYQSGTPEEMVVDYLPSSAVSRNNCFVDGGPYNVPYAEEPLEHHSSPTSYVEQWVEGQSQSHLSPLRHRTQWNSTRLHDHTPSPNSSSNGALALVEGGSSSLLCLSGDRDWDQSVAVGVATGVHERSPAHFVPDEAQPLSSSSRNTHRPPSVNATRSATSTPGVDKSRTLHANTPREAYSGSGRSSGNPPVGVSRCASCRATHSPEWRKGPSGKKDLCNACGLRYARNRAKKEGITTRKRKEKEKGSTKHTSSTSLSANSDGQPSSVTPCTQDQLTFDESTRQARGSPSNLSDLSGSGLLHYSAIRQDGSFEGSVRPYSRSESPSYADGFKVSEVRCHDGPHVFSSGPPSNTKGASPTLIQSANQLSPYLGNRELVGSSTRIFSNVERGSYETSSSRMGGFDYNRQVLTSPRDGPEQNSLLSASVQQPSFPSGSRFIGKSSPLRSTTDL